MNKVIYAKLHVSPFIPGLGGLKDTLPPDNKVIPNLAIELLEDKSILLTWGTNSRAIIPSANIVIAVLAPEEAKKPTIVK